MWPHPFARDQGGLTRKGHCRIWWQAFPRALDASKERHWSRERGETKARASARRSSCFALPRRRSPVRSRTPSRPTKSKSTTRKSPRSVEFEHAHEVRRVFGAMIKLRASFLSTVSFGLRDGQRLGARTPVSACRTLSRSIGLTSAVTNFMHWRMTHTSDLKGPGPRRADPVIAAMYAPARLSILQVSASRFIKSA